MNEAKAAKIKLVILDVDGVLTDGALYYGAEGELMKAFNVRDGLGIRLLLEHGISVAIITGRTSKIVEARAQELGIAYVYQGRLNKLQALEELSAHLQLDFSQMAFMGDDIIDLPILSRVGLAAIPKNAHPAVQAYSHFISGYKGGRGAVRELADFILSAQSKLDVIMTKTLAQGEILKDKAKTSC